MRSIQGERRPARGPRECEGVGGWAGHQAPQGLRAAVALASVLRPGWGRPRMKGTVCLDLRLKRSPPPESLVTANNDDMKMMIQRLHLYRGRSLQSIFTSSTLPSAP